MLRNQAGLEEALGGGRRPWLESDVGLARLWQHGTVLVALKSGRVAVSAEILSAGGWRRGVRGTIGVAYVVVQQTLDDGCSPPKRVGPDVLLGTLIEAN